MRPRDVAVTIARWLAHRQAAEQDTRLARSARAEALITRAGNPRIDGLRRSGQRAAARLVHR